MMLKSSNEIPETVTTPPCSSSPIEASDAMEISPLLPHKPAFTMANVRESSEKVSRLPPLLLAPAPIPPPRTQPPQMGTLRLPERLLNFE